MIFEICMETRLSFSRKGAHPMKIETIAVHAGRKPEAGSGAVAQAIQLSTTFERDPDGSFPRGHIYARSSNPNRQNLESCLAALEGGAGAAAFASGSAATFALFQALGPGDHVIAPVDAYYGTALQLREILQRWALQISVVDMTELSQLESAFRPNTKLVWVETPSNPLLRIVDIKQVLELAHSAGARIACDSTWATPVLQRPLDLGCDLVMHSTTKYLGGHSDVLSGALISRTEDDFFQRIRKIQTAGGAIPSPFDCWLVRRGISTLPWRVRAQSEQALQIARYLNQHPAVERVHYPGLPGHPGHCIAVRQMKWFGGMLAFQVKGDANRAMAVAAKVKVFTRATSLGGVESLIEHRASIEGPGTTTPENLLRVSVGLEHVDDLIADLDQALK
jgi:cystathionine gamma-synthase